MAGQVLKQFYGVRFERIQSVDLHAKNEEKKSFYKNMQEFIFLFFSRFEVADRRGGGGVVEMMNGWKQKDGVSTNAEKI